MANLIGQTLGQYQITALLGKGGMATVYRARQASINRDVAIKVIKPDLIESEEFKVRFSREAQVIAALSHPHILKVFDYGQHGDLVYLVMELLSGGSLADWLRKGGRLALPEVTRLLDQIASALDYAHRRAIVHRDLKPQNVLLDEERNAFLTDFGIAKLLSETSALTQSGTAMGTPAYMSPEQWRGQNVDGRADIYALGVMLYEMLAGRVPFTGDTPYSMMHMHVFEALPNIRTARPDLPQAVQSVLSKSMAKDRDGRFSTAGELANAFKAALAGVPTSAPTASDGIDVTSPVPALGENLDLSTIQAPLPSQPTDSATARGATPLGLAAEPERKPANRLPLLLGIVIVALIGVLVALLALGGDQGGAVAQVTATATETLASTNTQAPTATERPTEVPTQTALALAPPASPTDVPTLTLTFSPTPSPEPTLTLTVTATSTATATLTATETPSPEATQLAIPPTEPHTATRTATVTATYTASFTATVTPTATLTATRTPSLTRTPSPTRTPNLTVTARAEARLTAQAEIDARRTEAYATITSAAATRYLQRTRLAQLLTATALARTPSPIATPTPNLTATAQAFFANITATLVAAAGATATEGYYVGLKLTEVAKEIIEATAKAESPSGRIIFHTDLNGRWEINQVTLPDRTFSRLTDGRGVYYLPSFSADGELIALSSNVGGAIEIFTMRADGSALRRLTSQGGENWGAAISPDNRRVVWHSNRPGTFRLFIANLDGTGIRQLTQRDPQGRSIDADASWSPDGTQIVFASSRTPKGLYILFVDEGVLKHIEVIGEDAEDPAWSPDGNRIAFQSKRDGNLEIYVFDLTNGTLRRLTDHPASDGRPAWSPDGQWIAFESEREGKLDIYIMRADGSDVRRVTSNPGRNGWPSWAR
jgi:serine/threonine-protein kinase